MQIYYAPQAAARTTSQKSFSGTRLFQLIVALACAAYLVADLPAKNAPQSSANTTTISTSCD